jgi:UrcA family protein
MKRFIVGTGSLMVLVGFLPVSTLADQPAVARTVSSVAGVPVADLDLSTPDGMRLARDRLHAWAERICAERSSGSDPSTQPAFGACVDGTVVNALHQIEALRPIKTTARSLATRTATVSLADLDLSTPEGARIARERLEVMARRVCGELARLPDSSYQPNYVACVRDTLAGALAQADAVAMAGKTRATASVP